MCTAFGAGIVKLMREKMADNYNVKSAAAAGVAQCSVCHKPNPIEHKYCSRCHATLHLRQPNSMAWTLALLITAALFYIPANMFPIMTTTVLGEPKGSTIIGGVVLFLQTGSYFVGLVIFTASILIPLVKMMAIAWLCYCCMSSATYSAKELTTMYRLVEFIGKWSMIDVFVVALLVALVQLTGLMSIEPGLALRAFALVVILTMLSAHMFDVRLLWDKMNNDK